MGTTRGASGSRASRPGSPGGDLPAQPRWPAPAGDTARPPTPLQRQLAEPERQRPQPVDALRLARRTLLDSRRLDMRALAEELGVNRVTLYRWVGGREQLLVEVLWSMTQYRFDKILAELSDHRGPRVPELLRRWTRITVDAPGIRTFLYGENELAMRLLTLESGGFQPRLLGLVRQCIEDDIAEGRFDSPLPVDELAFAAVRICESYIYLPVITGAPADPDKVYRVLDVLMPGSDTGSARSKPARTKPPRTRSTETPPTEPASRRSDR